MRSFLLALSLLAGTPAAAQAPVRAGVLAVAPGEVTLGLSGRIEARVLALADPLRLVVDLNGVDAARVTATGGDLSARLGPFDPATARLVIALKTPMRIAAAVQDRDFRLRLKLVAAAPGDFAVTVKAGRRPLPVIQTMPAAPPVTGPLRQAGEAGAPVVPPDFDLPDNVFGPPSQPVATPPPADAQPVKIPPDERPRVRPGVKPLVVIDAGHGGKDVGAIAVDGGYEKNVTLAIARAAARALERGGKVRVHLTRADDRFIPLGGRVAIARAKRADLFISVHADAAPNDLARGATVYTLSEVASDAAAARLAARENRADIIAGVNLGGAPEVQGILLDLLRRSTLNGAATFADMLQDALDEDIGFRKNFRGFAGFRVLKATEIPSVLLETGYVSNAEDAALLFSKSGQRKIGDGIARAVEAYLVR